MNLESHFAHYVKLLSTDPSQMQKSFKGAAKQIVIHGDLNLGNMLFDDKGQKVIGLIDFADVRRTRVEMEFAKLANDPVIMLATARHYESITRMKIDYKLLLMTAVADSYYFYRQEHKASMNNDRLRRRREAAIANLDLCMQEAFKNRGLFGLLGLPSADKETKKMFEAVRANIIRERSNWEIHHG